MVELIGDPPAAGEQVTLRLTSQDAHSGLAGFEYGIDEEVKRHSVSAAGTTEITFTTPAGVHRYRVTSTEVVEPHETRILADRGRDELTLVTCYPFHYIGPAPQRFVVHAEAVPAP